MKAILQMAGVAFLAWSGYAVAADQPPLAPTRPVAVTYSVVGPPNGPGKVAVVYDSDARRVRLDFYRAIASQAPTASLIFDTEQDRAVTLIPERKAYMQRDAKGLANPGLFLGPALSYTRHGTEHFAGLTCTDWTIKKNNADANACITEDGVVLKANGAGASAQHLTAIAVTYGPPPADAFNIPKNYRLVVPPAQQPQVK